MTVNMRGCRGVWMRAAVVVLLLGVASACGADDNDNDDDNGDIPDPGELTYAPCSRATKVGELWVELADDYTGVNGQIFDSVVPQDIPEQVMQDGECRVYKARNLFCDPSCETGKTCDENNTCIPYHKSISAGTITLTGLLEVSPLTMTPSAMGNYYTNPDPLPHPGFSEGAEIELRASGDDTAPFALAGWGIGPIEAPAQPIPVKNDQPVNITWTPPALEGPVGMHIEVNINNHGANTVWIECEVEDTGSFDIPKGLVNELFAYGTSGFPTVLLVRRSADSTTLADGCMQFSVLSSITLEAAVDGVISCSEDKPCPDQTNQRCTTELVCVDR